MATAWADFYKTSRCQRLRRLQPTGLASSAGFHCSGRGFHLILDDRQQMADSRHDYHVDYHIVGPHCDEPAAAAATVVTYSERRG